MSVRLDQRIVAPPAGATLRPGLSLQFMAGQRCPARSLHHRPQSYRPVGEVWLITNSRAEGFA